MKNHKKDEKRAFIYGLKAENMKNLNLQLAIINQIYVVNFQNISGVQVSLNNQ